MFVFRMYTAFSQQFDLSSLPHSPTPANTHHAFINPINNNIFSQQTVSSSSTSRTVTTTTTTTTTTTEQQEGVRPALNNNRNECYC